MKLLVKNQSFPHLCKQAMLRPERFPVLFKITPIVLVLPSSSASCERGLAE